MPIFYDEEERKRFFDDKAWHVITNTGQIVGEPQS